MRLSQVWVEARRNLSSGTSRAMWMALLLALIGGAPALSDIASTRQVLTDAARFQSSGASIFVVTAKGQIDGRACDSLNAASGVRAAGALRPGESIVPLGTPDNPLPVKEVTPGFERVLGFASSVGRPGLAVSRQVAQQFRVSPERPLHALQGPVTISAVYDYLEDGRQSDLAFAALSLVPSGGAFDACWVDIWPYSDLTIAAIRTAVSALPRLEEVQVSQLNPTLGSSFAGDVRFADRPTSSAALVALALGIIVGILMYIPRRLELTAALHLGVSRRALLGQLFCEFAVWASIGLSMGMAVILMACQTTDSRSTHQLFAIGLRSLLGAFGGTACGALTGFAAFREHHFYAYFKNR